MNIVALLFALAAIFFGCVYVIRNHVGWAVACLTAALIVQFATSSHTVHV